MKTAHKTEFGDFQTPLALAREVCELLRRLKCSPEAVLEPTFGLGAFLIAGAQAFPGAKLNGLEINGSYLEEARKALEEIGALDRVTRCEQDFFTQDWEVELESVSGSLLILGNPPWVTNSVVASRNARSN